MKTLTQYRDDIKALEKKAGDISAKAVAENRDPSEEELALQNDLMDEIDGIAKIVATLDRRERLHRKLDEPADPQPLSRSGNPPPPDAGSRERFASIGEQAMAIKAASRPGGSADPRLFKAAISGVGEAIPSDGGFLIQKDFSQQWLEDLMATNLLWARVGRRITISGNANGTKINGFDETSRASSRGGGMISYWVGEGNQLTGTKPKFREIQLNLHKLTGLCYVTEEEAEDAAQLAGTLQNGFQSEFGFRLDDGVVNGTGAGQPLGLLNAGSLVTVTKETGQRASTIVAENIIKMYSRMFAASVGNAVWLVNQDTLPQLFTLSLAVGTGGAPIFMPAGGLSQSPYNTLLGRPVLPIEQCATLGTKGDIIFADLTRGYVVAEKGGLKTDMSIHLRFDYAESVWRFMLRVDGQPIRAAAVTPYKGSNTQSHFVCLETRS